MAVPQILKAVESYDCKDVLLTGGEPLLQKEIVPLLELLKARNFNVSIETHLSVFDVS